MDNYESLAQAPLGDNILAQIAATARDILSAQLAVTAAEEELKTRQAHLKALEEGVMPELMSSAGQEKLTTIDGLIVEVKDMVRGQPSIEQKPKAFAWLRANHQGGIIKAQIKADLGKGSEELKTKALAALAEIGVKAFADESVHHQTLGSLVRELLAKGKEVPLETLGVNIWKKAEVKPK